MRVKRFPSPESLVIQLTGDSYVIMVNGFTFEAPSVSVNIIIDDEFAFGLDNPRTFESYEDVPPIDYVELERFEDGSIDVEVIMKRPED